MPLAIGKMTVNVSLCGAIPRSNMASSPSKPFTDTARPQPFRREKLSDLTSSDLNQSPMHPSKYSFLAVNSGSNGRVICEENDRSRTDSRPVVNSDRPLSLLLSKSLSQSQDSIDTITDDMPRLSNTPRPPPVVDPPRWAVPAKGEARLEPVCEALGTHCAVDLTSNSSFRVGRSPSSDIQLMHNTSSRRHALLFHHPNGNCYIVDCGSAHGTFVNGVRVRSTPSAGMIIPHRVRRGALIRFGGPGAPSFVLKSFSVGFSYMVKDLESPSCHPTLSPTSESHKEVQVNTRLNALGKTPDCIGGILRKRSADESDDVVRSSKRRCISPLTHSPESSPVRLVSPDPSTRRVTFNEVPQAFYPSLVSPDISSDDASLEE